MAVLTVGRLGFDVDLHPPVSTSYGPDRLELVGELLTTTAGVAKAQRTELLAMAEQGGLVAVTLSEDSSIDGFYELLSADLDAHEFSLAGGHYPYRISLRRIGSAAEVEFESMMTGGDLVTDHSLAGSPFLAPPRGHDSFHPDGITISTLTRTGSGGGMTVYRDVDRDKHPVWAITPGSFYDGAVQFKSGSGTERVRAGLYTPDTPGAWTLENELVRVTPNGTGGRIDVAHHDGSQWETAKTWRVQDDGADVGPWDHVSLLRNDPEEVIVRLVRGAAGGGRWTLDLALRRGSRFVSGFLSASSSATLKIVRASTEAGTAFTGGVRATSNDGDGNRYVVGCEETHTADTTDGGLSVSSTTTLPFFLGSEVGGSGAASGDAAADLMGQYLGYLTESAMAVRR